MRMFNSDGSEAQMCGNGIRCVAKLAYELGLICEEITTIETLSGIKTLKLNIVNGKVKNSGSRYGSTNFRSYQNSSFLKC